MMARESKKGKKESDKKSTNRRKKRSHERRTGIEIEDASAQCVLISQQLQLQWLTTPNYPPINSTKTLPCPPRGCFYLFYVGRDQSQ